MITDADIEKILNDPQVLKVTDNVNEEMLERRQYKPRICNAFSKAYTHLESTDDFQFDIDPESKRQLHNIIHNKVQRIKGSDSPSDSLKSQYEKARNIGIVFSGGPAPGGHNVIAGLYDAAKKANPRNKVFGFLMGPDGIMENEAVELNDTMIDSYRNIGGFTMIKTGRSKIDNDKKMALSRETCKELKLDALVVVGGDDSNTNAAFLAQEMFHDKVQVIGVPKTIDGDIQVRDNKGHVLCAISFGFHSAARAFAGSISNLCTDGSSDIKYWHICKVMGRVASHLALEVAFQTHANMTFIGEDLANYTDPKRLEKPREQGATDYTAYGMTLRHLSRVICDGIVRRSAVGKNYGVIVIPEGVLEFINEIQVFIIKLNTIIAMYNRTHDTRFHSDFPALEDKMEYLRKFERQNRESGGIAVWNSRDMDLFNDLPDFFKDGLLTERDSHGNFQFSLVETDKIVMGLVKNYLKELTEKGVYKVGIHRDYYKKILKKAGLDPDFYGQILFKNYGEEYLLVKPAIISGKTLTQALVKGGAIGENGNIPPAVEKIYKKSVPGFNTQLHFYGYDGRGSNPTRFDCTYTYNLGLTVFSLIANGATGLMASVKNLELPFEQWEPIGIPIAPLMHLEERGGKLSLVIEKSIVDVNSVAFKVVKALREKWLTAAPGDDNYRHPGPIRLCEQGEEDRPIILTLNALGRK